MRTGILGFLANARDGFTAVGEAVIGTTEESFPDPLDEPDALEREFRKLEREVRQRECDHERTVEIVEMGQPPEDLCTDCGLIS